MKGLRSKTTKRGRKSDKTKNLTSREKKLLQETLKYEPRLLWWLFADLWLWTIEIVTMAIKHLFEKDLKYWKVHKLLVEMW